jgi:PAS domain S-box-containing protein
MKEIRHAGRKGRETPVLPDTDEDMPIAFYTLNRQGRICEVNERGAKLLGFSTAWLIGRPFLVFVARQDVRRFLKILGESVHRRGQSQMADLDIHVADRTVPVQISLTTRGQRTSLVHRLTVVDMTDVRNTERLLAESRARWFSIVQNAPDTIMTMDLHGRIAFVNRPVWGYSSRALIGTTLDDHVPDFERLKLRRCLEHAVRHGRPSVCEVTGVNGDWKRWFSFSFGSPDRGRGADGTTTLIIREISEHKRTEERLRASGEQMRDFAAKLEAVREEERTRVAREIHDELGQALTALKLDLSWIQSRTPASSAMRKKMKGMIAQVDATIECVRRISSELRPAILDDLGLIPAIEWQVAEFRKRTRIRTELAANAEGLSLPMEASAAVFRVVQEALTNVMRHADASKVRVEILLKDRALLISIADNGNGMSRKREMDLKSLGIVGMRERIARLGGDFNIFSGPGQGTRIDIVIPTRND